MFNLFKDKPFKCFIGEYGDLRTSYRSYQGVKSIPVDRIVGTVGRCHQDSRWRDIKKSYRYREIKRAMKDMTPMPAIEVYQVEDEYYVVDGHHRVMASREIGREYIDAEVEEIGFAGEKEDSQQKPCPMDYDQCPMKDFEERTGIRGILLDSKQQYQKLLDYIKEIGIGMTMEEFSWNWYRNDFLPFSENNNQCHDSHQTCAERYYREKLEEE